MQPHQIQFYRGPTRGLTCPKIAKALAFAAALPFHIVRCWRDLILGKKPENRRDRIIQRCVLAVCLISDDESTH